jgi:hypothetical protein
MATSPSQACHYTCCVKVIRDSYERVQHLPLSYQIAVAAGTVIATSALGGGIVIKNNKLVFFLPGVVYDFIQHIFFPVNYFIGTACSFFPTRNSIWSEKGFETKTLEGSGKDTEEIRASILSKKDVSFNEEDLVNLYDSCPVVSARNTLIGRSWNGMVLRTNRSVLDVAEWLLVRPLGLFGFKWGKRYLTQHTGDPLLVRWLDTIYFPLPVWGNVGMVDIRWRGECTATMNYDYQPWKDYFRLLSNEGDDEIVLLGVWTHKDKAGGWFVLRYDRNVPTI